MVHAGTQVRLADHEIAAGTPLEWRPLVGSAHDGELEPREMDPEVDVSSESPANTLDIYRKWIGVAPQYALQPPG
jgi:hypothetical protein